MAERSTALTAAAGEHFVAFKLSAMGYPVALTRGGSPTVDLMVGDLSGNAAVSLQVKTSSGARRQHKRERSKVNDRWEWDVGRKALDLRGDSIFYVFVDLKWDHNQLPDVFIVPSCVVADAMGPDYSRFMFWLRDADANEYRDRWDFITSRLSAVTIPVVPAPPV